jgi:hypothetical protein
MSTEIQSPALPVSESQCLAAIYHQWVTSQCVCVSVRVCECACVRVCECVCEWVSCDECKSCGHSAWVVHVVSEWVSSSVDCTTLPVMTALVTISPVTPRSPHACPLSSTHCVTCTLTHTHSFSASPHLSLSSNCYCFTHSLMSLTSISCANEQKRVGRRW